MTPVTPTDETPVIRKVTKERDDLQAVRPDSESDLEKSDEENTD